MVFNAMMLVLSTFTGNNQEGRNLDSSSNKVSSTPKHSSKEGLAMIGFGFSGRDGSCALNSQLANLLGSPGLKYFTRKGGSLSTFYDTFTIVEAKATSEADVYLDGVRWISHDDARFAGTAFDNIVYQQHPVCVIDAEICAAPSPCGVPKSMQRNEERLKHLMKQAASSTTEAGYVLAFDTSIYLPVPVVTQSDFKAVIKGEVRYLSSISGGGVYLGRSEDVREILLGRLSVDGKDDEKKERKVVIKSFENYTPKWFGSHGIPSTFTRAGYSKSEPGGVVADKENICMRGLKATKQ